jgi:hypothetical protein
MGFMTQLFSAKELEALDEKESQILRDAILQQIQTSPEINTILRKMLNKDPGSGGPAKS